MSKPALGRGLGALLGGATNAPKTPVPAPKATAATTTTVTAAALLDPRDRVQRVPLEKLHPCPFQPRKAFSPESLQELADSIQAQGIIQPLVVRPRADGFEIIAGERRWRAAQLAGVREVPVIIRDADDREVLELALIENLQRENLNPLDEAHGFSELIERFQLRQEDVAAKVGKSRAAVANSLRLLRLPSAVQTLVREGRLSTGHAKVILGLSSPDEQQLAATRVLQQGLNVRQTEDLVANLARKTSGIPPVQPAVATPVRDPNLSSLEGKLRERLGTRVQLRYRDGKGALDIRFFSDAELERLLQILGIQMD
ncbi:MAG: ParB family transcriptional regulator, chromosome partitioning protein [Verrucomicrobiota bacterium]|jgi:ParB family chromosome partitioning protein